MAFDLTSFLHSIVRPALSPVQPALLDQSGLSALSAPFRQGIGRDGAVAGGVAYLTNAYPKTSHSFIRTEIAALERHGIAVTRITIRRTPETLVDPADIAEAERTHELLGDDRRAMIRDVWQQVRRRPWGVLSAIGLLLGERRGWAGPVRSAAYLVEACRLLTMTQAAGIGHVHIHFGTNPATVARLARRIGSLTYSVTVHGPDEFDAPRALMLHEKIADARFVAAVSEFGRAQLMRWSDPADWPKLAVVRCGVGREWRQPPSEQEEGLRSRTLVCVARLSAQKGIPLLLDAAAELLARGRDFRIRIIGDGELRRSLERRIASRGLAGHVELVGLLGSEGVAREIMAARAMVLPSFAEGLPVVLMEALALGRPVIATAIAGIPELVDARCGWLIPAGSVAALTEAMDAALRARPATLAAMAARGAERVARDHDVDTNAATLATLLREAMAGGGTGR